jgi:hypothetical protein
MIFSSQSLAITPPLIRHSIDGTAAGVGCLLYISGAGLSQVEKRGVKSELPGALSKKRGSRITGRVDRKISA